MPSDELAPIPVPTDWIRLEQARELADCTAELEKEREENWRLRQQVDNLTERTRLNPDPYHHWYQLGIIILPFFFGAAALADVVGSFSVGSLPKYALDAAFAGAGLLIATWDILDRFWKYRDEAGLMPVYMLALFGIIPGMFIGLLLAGAPI